MKTLATILLLLCSMAAAERRLVVPPFPRRLVFQSTNPPNPSQTTGVFLHVSVFLTNPGTLRQTGTIVLGSGSSGYGAFNQVNPIYFDRHLVLCSPTDAAGATSSASAGPLTLPRTVQWAVNPGQTTRVTVGFAIRRAILVGPILVDTEFTPSLVIRINEDRGALVASAIPQSDGMTQSALCDGTDFRVTMDLVLPNDRSGNPLFFNGSRPF